VSSSADFDCFSVDLLSRVILAADREKEAATACAAVECLGAEERKRLLEIASWHHVPIRALSVLQQHAALQGAVEAGAWAQEAVNRERERIDRALGFLEAILRDLEAAGLSVTTIKTLDHWPDFGSDIDLYTSANAQSVARVLAHKWKARLAPRSWGDRLARKWNFVIPGLPELIEVHSQRLGQTGEQTLLARRFLTRRTFREAGGYSLPVPAPEERIIVATLQRMYRHFYFRLSDIVNTGNLVDGNGLDYRELRAAAALGGVWPGVATYLKIASDYVERYRGTTLPLPGEVLRAARFGGEKLEARTGFLRVPIVPDGASLYARQMTETALSGNVPAALRLSLLPPLASLAALSYKITGNDKGIW
jgi:hypothetical protein